MPRKKIIKLDHKTLERLYSQYNHKKYVHPDPLEFLYLFNDIKDREIAGLIASSLAYGRVNQILKSVACILDLMQPSPHHFCKELTPGELRKIFKNFKHRFTTGEDISKLISGIGKAINRYGSLEKCFLDGYSDLDRTLVFAMEKFAEEIYPLKRGRFSLLTSPREGSACKRLNLFLRWMIRKDGVDPGGWDIPASKLLVPLDIHMFKISRTIGFTKRKSADLKTAIEVTERFAIFSPNDPAKYDFCLTRSGIHPSASKDEIFKKCGIIESFPYRIK